jgi:hypothetical protein
MPSPGVRTRLARLFPRAARLRDLEEHNRRLSRKLRRLQRRELNRSRPDLGYVFVMTYGRSGSTLVQGLLNAIPGYLIRGENHNVMRSLFEFHRRGVADSTRPGGRRVTQPWFGARGFPAEKSIENIRALALQTILRPGPRTRVTGYKEIRWPAADLADYVAFLREVFPGARFVVNTRDLEAVSRSQWWAEDESSHDRLADIEAAILAVAEDLGPAAYRIHYDDYVADPDVLQGLFEWLGEPWDAELVRATLAVKHSY